LVGEFAIPPRFEFAFPFDACAGVARVLEKRDGMSNYGLINVIGEYVMAPQYSDLRTTSEGLLGFASHVQQDLYGYADLSGKVILEPRYRYVTPFRCGLALVSYPGEPEHCFFINRQGRHVLGPFFGSADERMALNSDGIARVQEFHEGRPGGTCFINASGEVLLRPQRKRLISQFSDGLARAYDEDLKKYGFVNISGDWVVPAKYDDAALSFSNGYAEVRIGGELRYDEQDDLRIAGARWGLIDTRGREILPLRYGDDTLLQKPACGLIRFAEPPEGPSFAVRFGYLSALTGTMSIPAKFKRAERFSEGFAIVAMD
jgi:hypothetical protein